VADHGKVWKTPLYTIPTSFNHVPLIIYSPKLAPAVCSNLGGQIDIAPTLLGILGIDYQDTSLGVNLLREQRPCMFFTSDDAIGCVDSTYFYIYKPREKKEQLFRYAHRETEDLHTTLTAETDSLRNYAWSMLQAAQYVTDGIIDKRMGR
jgi:arylsulfatase A-like enzyme